MIEKEITWEGLFDEETHTEKFYFHLTKDDLISMELAGNLTDAFRKLQESEDDEERYNYIKKLIRGAYGIRDGNDFDKTDEAAIAKFMRSPAFDSLIIDLLSNEKAAIEFIIGIFPRDLSRQISQADIDRAMAEAKEMARERGLTGDTEDVPLPADPADKPDLEDLTANLTQEDALEIIRRQIHEA